MLPHRRKTHDPEENEVQKRKTMWQLERRFVVIGLLFSCMFLVYVERVGFSIAYTSMAHDEKIGDALKGGVLSSFFYGYGTSQVILLFQNLQVINF